MFNWKNVRMRNKLLFGFGLLLVVFAAAVGLAWVDIEKAVDSSKFMSNVLVDSIRESSELEREFYEAAQVVQILERKETAETAEATRAKMLILKKGFADMAAFGTSYPALKAPAYWRDTVAPLCRNFDESVQRTYTVIDNKAKTYAAIGEAGATVVESAKAMLDMFSGIVQEEIEGNNDKNRITAMLGMWNSTGDILIGTMEARRVMQKAMMDSDPDAMRKLSPVLGKAKGDAEKMLAAASSPERAQIVKSLVDSLGAYRGATDDFAKAHEDLNKEMNIRTDLMAALSKETTNASTLAVNSVDEITSENVVDLAASARLLMVSIIVSIALGVIIALFIAGGISGPLNRIVGLAERARNGDLTVAHDDFRYSGRDEMGKLVNALSAMIDAQEGAMKNIAGVAQNLFGESHNLSEIAERSNASMEEIKASIDQVSTLSESNGAALEECNLGVEEMSAGANTVAQAATESAEFLSETTSLSSNATAAVDKVIKGMRDVETNAGEVAAKTRQLITSVENVSGFVSVITSIADQTNLLALNAAIEAARAGEVGRGFAVVAEEVRKLAEESARAAQSVGGIIGELQSGSRESIDAIAVAAKILTATLVQAKDAQKGLDDALGGINKANDSIQNIAAVAEEQAASSKEVATGIDNATRSTMEMVSTVSNIRLAADSTTQAAQGVAEQAEAIQTRVDTLTEVLSHFKLKADKDTPKPKNESKKALTKPVRALRPVKLA
ncbi:hypothetical protein FACS1894187_14350 [Synergistales bacterium]|nr:hypothetical protein FACS1894187_14350 [Synergistales bacterium]